MLVQRSLFILGLAFLSGCGALLGFDADGAYVRDGGLAAAEAGASSTLPPADAGTETDGDTTSFDSGEPADTGLVLVDTGRVDTGLADTGGTVPGLPDSGLPDSGPVDLARGLLLSLSFDDGLASDSTGNHPTVSAANLAPATDRFGNASKAAHFTQSQRSLVQISPNLMPLGSSPRSLALWVRPTITAPPPVTADAHRNVFVHWVSMNAHPRCSASDTPPTRPSDGPAARI